MEERDKEIERLNRALDGGRPYDVISLESQNISNEKLIAHLNLQVPTWCLCTFAYSTSVSSARTGSGMDLNFQLTQRVLSSLLAAHVKPGQLKPPLLLITHGLLRAHSVCSPVPHSQSPCNLTTYDPVGAVGIERHLVVDISMAAAQEIEAQVWLLLAACQSGLVQNTEHPAAPSGSKKVPCMVASA